MRERLANYWPLAASLILIIVDQWLFMGICKELRNPIGAAIKMCGDAAVILLPYWYLPPRWRWSVIAPVWALTLLLTCSLLNYRAFADILSPMALTMTGNVNSAVLPSILSLIRPIDFAFCAAAAVFTFCIFRYRSSYIGERFSLRTKLSATLLSILLYLLSQVGLSWSHRNFFRDEIGMDVTLREATRLRLSDHIFTHIGDYEGNGLLLHSWRAVAEAIEYMDIRRELTDEQRQEIRSFLSEPAIAPDTAATTNRKKNIILILTESLNSYAIETTIDGHEVTPVLRWLIDQPGTVSALNVVSQIADGTSSDGQLMTNTGLLPLRRGVVGLMVGSSNRFIALPERLERASASVVFGENGATWNKVPTFANWGFTSHTIADFQQEADAKGIDGALMDFALDLIPQLEQPYLLELVTMSTHMPFATDGMEVPSWLTAAEGLEEIERNYLTTVNYFDAQLGRLIEDLHAQGIWDDCILIVASDHSSPNALPKGHDAIYPADIPMTFIAANTHLTDAVERTVGQIDIYPTILYLTGYYADGEYNGLGTPIVCADLRSAYTFTRGLIGDSDSPLSWLQTEAAKISELIVRGDYFRQEEF